jgi:hypothetical protein
MPFSIPEDINSFSMAESFRFYRDTLGWQVYPVYPPWANVKDPGKRPVFKAWGSTDPQDCDIAKYFDNGRPYNIGVAPKNGLLILDLDSKRDQGGSVRAYLGETEELKNIPRHLSNGGAHLALVCPDLPAWKNPKNGKPIHKVLSAKLNDKVSVELYHCEHLNVVLPPSVHPSGFKYVWTVFGLIPELLWRLIQQTFNFDEPVDEHPEKRGRPKAWYTKFRGDLSSLDLIGLLESLGHESRVDAADECRYIVKCPWLSEHSDPTDDTGGKVWQTPEAWPQFHCHHNSCRSTNRGLKEVLEWAEGKSSGIVDKFCALERVWHAGQKSRQGLPRVLQPAGRLETAVYEEIGAIIGPKYDWFTRGEEITVVKKVAAGFVYSDNPATKYSVSSFQIGLSALSALQAKSSLEKYIEPGYLRGDPPEFIPCSFATEFCAGLLQAEQLKTHLFDIVRVLPVPLPFRVDERLLYPKPGYDPQFGTYLLPDALTIKTVSLQYGLEVIERLYNDFCFTNQQSKTHAIAALLTPFSKALIGWTTRTPLWYYSANRPRAGKD